MSESGRCVLQVKPTTAKCMAPFPSGCHCKRWSVTLPASCNCYTLIAAAAAAATILLLPMMRLRERCPQSDRNAPSGMYRGQRVHTLQRQQPINWCDKQAELTACSCLTRYRRSRVTWLVFNEKPRHCWSKPSVKSVGLAWSVNSGQRLLGLRSKNRRNTQRSAHAGVSRHRLAHRCHINIAISRGSWQKRTRGYTRRWSKVSSV